MDKNNRQQEVQRVAIYIRVSTDDQAEKYGRELQESAIQALIQSRSNADNKLVFAGDKYVYIDDGITGTMELNQRPAFARLQEDIVNSIPDNKPFDVVAVYKIDRFARRLKILLNVIDFFKDNDVKFLSVNESIDTSTPFGNAMLGIMGVIAELEIETIKQRTQGGREEAVKSGVIMGNASIFGYKKDKEKRAEIFEPEAEVVKLIFSLFINEKLSVGLIVHRLKELKQLSPQASALYYKKRVGKSTKINNPYHWSANAVRRTLSDEMYKGDYYYAKTKGSRILPKDQWKLSPYPVPQIIDDITFEKARRLLEQSKHERKITPSNHIYLLSGLLVCDDCYNPIQDSITGRKHWVGSRKKLDNGKYSYSYSCIRKNTSKYDKNTLCTTLPLPAEEIEKYIILFTERLLKNPLATFEYQNKLKSTQKGIEHLQKQEKQYIKLIQGIPGRVRNLRLQHEHSHISISLLNAGIKEANSELKKYEDRLKDIRKNVSEHTVSDGYIKSIELFSKKYKPALEGVYKNRSEIYHILHTLIEEVVVYSRPLTKDDIIAGTKKENQHIPCRLHIKLKLPQDILQDLMSSEQENISGERGETRTPNP